MLIIDDPFQSGVPALLVLLGAIIILAFIRLAVPRLIERFQTKKSITDRDIKK